MLNIPIQRARLAGTFSNVVAASGKKPIGALPVLPSTGGVTGNGYDILVSDAAGYRNAISGAPPAGTTYYIAIQDGATIDLGSTNINSGGFTDYTVTTNKDIVIAPQSWYAGSFTYMSDPFGDGELYTRMVVRPCTIIGWHIFTGGNPKMYGMKRTIGIYPAAPTSSTYERWDQIGIQQDAFLDIYYGSGSPDFSWNEYFIGKDVSHTPFNIGTKEYDMRSPDVWCYTGNSLITRAVKFTASFAVGSQTMTVDSITQGAMPIQVGHSIKYNNGGTPVVTTVTALGTGTGAEGTYIINNAAPANLSGVVGSASAFQNNALPTDKDGRFEKPLVLSGDM